MLLCPKCGNEIYAVVEIDDKGENYSETYECSKCNIKIKKEDTIYKPNDINSIKG